MTTPVTETTSRTEPVELHVFGAHQLVVHGEPVRLAEDPRTLLAMLLIQPHRFASAAELVDTLGPERVQGAVASLREALEGTGLAVVDSPAPVVGYTLSAADVSADLDACGQAVRAAILAIRDLPRYTRYVERAIAWLDSVSTTMSEPALAGLESAVFDTYRPQLMQARRAVARLALRLIASGPVYVTEESVTGSFPHLLSGVPSLECHWRHFRRVSRDLGPSGATAEFTLSMRATQLHQKWDLWGLSRTVETPAEWQALAGDQDNRTYLSRVLAPGSVYLGDGERHAEVERALAKLLREVGLDPNEVFVPVIRSWWRKLRFKVQDQSSHLSLEQVSAKLERCSEMLDRPQAAIDNQQATGAAALIAALQGESRACIRVGSLLVLKVDGQIVANNLTQYQLTWLERNQTLLRDPEGLLKGLESLPEFDPSAVPKLPTADGQDRVHTASLGRHRRPQQSPE